MTNNLRNVFISHIHEDDEGLGKLKALLESKGMTVRDYSIRSDNPNQATSEDYIKQEILKPRIEQAGVLVVYISEDTKGSSYVNWEIECAQRLGKRIVGVWADGEKGCDIPEALSKYADAIVGWTGDSIIDAIGGKDGHSLPDGKPYPPRSDFERVTC